MTKQQKRKRILIVASIEGVERARGILGRRGISSVSAFAKAQLLGKSSVDKFLNRQPIQADTFKKICEGLDVKDWKELAELGPVLDQSEQTAKVRILQGCLAKEDSREVGESFRRVTVLSPMGQIKAQIILEGSIETVTAEVRWMMESHMKNAGGDTIRITEIRSGSIKVTVQGSPRDIARLLDQINSGELTEVENFPIQGSQILSRDFLADVGQHSNPEKWELINDIVNNPKIARQLSGADLSDAYLSGADLSGADLSGADLSGADLSGADLSGAVLVSLYELSRNLDNILADLNNIFDHLDSLDRRALSTVSSCLDRLESTIVPDPLAIELESIYLRVVSQDLYRDVDNFGPLLNLDIFSFLLILCLVTISFGLIFSIGIILSLSFLLYISFLLLGFFVLFFLFILNYRRLRWITIHGRSALRKRLRNRQTLCFRLGSLNHSAKFEDADLTNAILKNCQFAQGMELNSAIVEGCQFGYGDGLEVSEKKT